MRLVKTFFVKQERSRCCHPERCPKGRMHQHSVEGSPEQRQYVSRRGGFFGYLLTQIFAAPACRGGQSARETFVRKVRYYARVIARARKVTVHANASLADWVERHVPADWVQRHAAGESALGRPPAPCYWSLSVAKREGFLTLTTSGLTVLSLYLRANFAATFSSSLKNSPSFV